jgi:hypothetical protein
VFRDALLLDTAWSSPPWRYAELAAMVVIAVAATITQR